VGQLQPWQRVVRLNAYHSPVSDWLKAMKFHGQWRWAAWFGRQLGRRLGEPFDGQRVAVCPVPMHWMRRLGRGYNQSALIAQAAAEQRGWPMADVLKRVRHTRPQTKVNPARRRRNVQGSFGIAAVDLTGWEIWLIDDIKTSGATAGHCARLLHEAGAAMVNLAVVAVADPRGGDFKVI
jgi:ComF family protein